MRPRIACEVAEDVLLQSRLRVRRLHAAKPVEAREQRARGVSRTVVDAGVATPAGGGVRPLRCHTVDELAEGANVGLTDAHAAVGYKNRAASRSDQRGG